MWKCEIVCLSETWLSSDISDSFLSIPSFSLFRRDRPQGNHGGLLVYASSHLGLHRRIDLEDPDIECVVLEFSMPSSGRFLIYFCYRPPSYPPDIFFQRLSSAISKGPPASLLVMGDFNAKHKQWSSAQPNSAGNHMCELLEDFCLAQCVTESTRYSADYQSSSTLDLLATNRPDLIGEILVSDPVSDHCRVTARLLTSFHRPKRESVQIPDYSKADWAGLRAFLHKTNLVDTIVNFTDVNSAWISWRLKFCKIVSAFVPTKTIYLKPKNKVWMTPCLHKISKQKMRLFRQAKANASEADWKQYKQCRNHYNAEIKKRKQEYINMMHRGMRNERFGSYNWWHKAKAYARISNFTSQIPDLETIDGKLVEADSDKAEVLASFFASQCSTPISEAGIDPGAPYPLLENHPIFRLRPISEGEVLKILQHLPVNKSSGGHEISNRVLRETALFIARSLTYLFNFSVVSRVFPTEWKSAVVTPIFKNRGSSREPTNYRPVSILHPVGKILDGIQSNRLLKFLVKNGLLSEHQFGFLPGRSTTQQLLYLSDKWARALANGHSVGAVFMDFHKAFDKVWHSGLLHKLASRGVDACALAWLNDYLSGRTLSVRVGGKTSNSYPITAGVPQGSHLGPVLFLAFIDDLPSETLASTELYADDALLHSVLSRATDIEELQSSVNLASAWAQIWRGRFAPAKTVALGIGNGAKALLQDAQLRIDGSVITVVDAHKHLGVFISSDLRWSHHVQAVILSTKKRAGLLRLMASDLPKIVSSELYLHFIRPSLEYACQVWHAALPSDLALSLERLQASIARSILHAPWTTPKHQLLEALDWPSLRWRRSVACVVYLHRLLRQKSKRNVLLSNALFPFHCSISTRDVRKPYQLILPHARTSLYIKSFFFHSSLLWNTLPHSLQSLKSNIQFKRSLEEHWRAYRFNTCMDIPLQYA